MLPIVVTGVQGLFDQNTPESGAIDKEIPLKQSIESGRVVSYKDHADKLRLGPNLLENWLILCLKGKERVQGVLVVEIEDEDIADAISILVNYASIVLDNLMLQEKVQHTITES